MITAGRRSLSTARARLLRPHVHRFSRPAPIQWRRAERGSMPRRCDVDPHLAHLISAQDQVLHRHQALAAGLSADAIRHRVRHKQWQILLPQVYLCHPGEPARRQRLIAALLYCGADSAIDGVDACRYHGLKGVAVDDVTVHMAVPPASKARSRAWVVVRQAAHFTVCRSDALRYVDPATAVIAATRRATSARRVLAVVSEATQRRIATPDELLRAHLLGPPKNAKLADDALGHVRRGVRSVPEGEFRTLAEAVPLLPPLLYNCVLRMPDGRRVSPDALAPDCPLIHETNGRVAHEREDLFQDMQARHDYLTACGFTVLHNSPRRIYGEGRLVISEFERCYRRLAGSGWPHGVAFLQDAN